MSIFHRKKHGDKAGQIEILAPLDGELIPVTQVGDPTFSEEMLGKGVAIRPSAGKVVSPVNGTVTQMFDTGHAVSLTSDEGVEILVHVGLNTVELKGQHYTKCVKGGDAVKTGDLLIEFDLKAIADAGYDTVTPVVVCNADEFDGFSDQPVRAVSRGDAIIALVKK